MTKRILVSWIAYYYDFDKESGKPSDEGPHVTLHREYYDDHDFHLLLYTEKGPPEPTSLLLKQHLEHNFPGHRVELVEGSLDNIYDNKEIKARVVDILEPYKAYTIDILTSTGTTPMRTTWSLIHLEKNGLNTHLLQSLSKLMGGGKAKILELSLDSSIIAGRIEATIKEETKPKDQFVPESLVPIYQQARQIARVSDARLCTLIQGPSGSGKELLARYLHQQSVRHAKPFIAVNCAALGQDLLESRLFGHKKGAYTGANEDRKGVFEEADGGWLFLDEVGDMSQYMQQALLRVLQERKVQRVGEVKERPVDVRIVAATNRDLWSECEKEKFRWDLYYRLAATELFLLPLASWSMEDKEALTDHLIHKRADMLGERSIRLSKALKEWMRLHSFPGNIRELEQLISHLFIFAPEERKVAGIDALPQRYNRKTSTASNSMDTVVREHARRIYLRSGSNLSLTARTLEISRPTLMKYLKKKSS